MLIIRHLILIVFILLFSCLKKTEDPEETTLIALDIKIDSLHQYVNQRYWLKAKYANPKGERSTVKWTGNSGTFINTVGDSIEWIAPSSQDTVILSFTVQSDLGKSKFENKFFIRNRKPTILNLNPDNKTVILGNKVNFKATVSDPDNEILSYNWTANAGSIEKLSDTEILWTSPSSQAGRYVITLNVVDANGANDTKSDSIISYRIQGSVWVGNSGEQNIKLFSEEGFLVKTVNGFSNPIDIQVDPVSLNLWVLDKTKKTLFFLNQQGIKTDSIKDLLNPQSIRIDETTHNLWLADASRVLEIESTTRKVLKTINGFAMARYLSLGKNYSLYVSDLLSNSLYVVSADTTVYNVSNQSHKHRAYSSYQGLANISYDESTKKLWFVDKSAKKVIFMNSDSTSVTELSHSFANPIFIRHSSVFNQTWINDDHNIIFYNNGTISSLAGDYSEISDIDIIKYSGNNEIWLVDTFNHRVLRVRDNGQIVSIITGLNTPRSIGINNGSR